MSKGAKEYTDENDYPYLRTAAKIQVLPVTNEDSQDVLDNLLRTKDYRGLVVDSKLAYQLEERVALGVRKYGTRLQTNNGRDVCLDIRQELLDGIMYAHQGVMQGKNLVGIRSALIKMVEELNQIERVL